jgi:transcriptional regulator with XRE-family HTH domain
MTDWQRAICARVKTARESINWSQAAFAKQLSITRDQLASIEGSRTPLRYDIAWRLRQSFGISLRWLEEGFTVPDNLEQDNLPIPDATGLPARALLSAVARKFSELGEETLEVMGLESTSAPNRRCGALSKPAAQISRPAAMLAGLSGILDLLSGQEGKTGRTDPGHRAMHADILKGHVDHWISRIPLGNVEAFSDKLMHAAEVLAASFPHEPSETIDRRRDELIWERIKIASARKILMASQAKKRVLTDVTVTDNVSPVKSTMLNLLERLNKATSQRGMKSKLAKLMGVPLSNVSQWLSGAREPGGETTLRLLNWVRVAEGKQESPGGVEAPPEPKTQLQRSKHENQSQARKKR